MKIITKELELNTEGYTDIINITDNIRKLLKSLELSEGQVTVFSLGSTGGITTLEYEPGLVNHDVKEILQKIAPYEKSYEHNKTWGDDNGSSHLRSAIFGTSYVIPFKNGELMLGTWQQIVFIDFDTRPRNRRIVVQFIAI